MCIAICVPKGVDIPTPAILKNCFENNNDGAGFAFNHDGQVIIRKGFMTLESFLNAIRTHDEKFNLKEKGVLIHTRITTHGGTTPEMCHPFPIIDDEGALKKIYYASPYAVIHNGIISLTSGTATKKGSMSDTAVFVEEYLSKIAENKQWFYQKANIELIEKLIDSKMAILNGNGEIIMTSGFKEDNGIFYSNTSYQDAYTRYTWTRDELEDYYYTKESRLDRMARTKSISQSTTCIGVQVLEKDGSVIFADGVVEDFNKEFSYLRDEKGNVYFSDNAELCNKTYIAKVDVIYYGDGIFVDKFHKPIDYKAKLWLPKTNFDKLFDDSTIATEEDEIDNQTKLADLLDQPKNYLNNPLDEDYNYDEKDYDKFGDYTNANRYLLQQ